MLENVLKKLGWHSGEVAVYTTLLSLGTQPASVIARHLSKKRTTIRVYLEQLVAKGFVRFTWRGKAQHFTAKKPLEALAALEQNKKEVLHTWDEHILLFSRLIPELTALVRHDVNIPKVSYFEGISELKQMYIDSLSSKTEILCLSSVEDLWDLFGKEYDEWYVHKRVKRKIPVRYIAKDTLVEHKEVAKDKISLRTSRHFPPAVFGITNEINIYDGKVSIITLKNEKIGILIQSQEIYSSMKVLFEALWAAAGS